MSKNLFIFIISLTLVILGLNGLIKFYNNIYFDSVNVTIIIVYINGNGDYTTIQYAINNTNSGDLIKIWDGRNNDDLKVNKSVTSF